MTTLRGGPELMAFLESLPAKLEQNILRGAMRAAATVVAKDAETRTNSPQIRDGIYVTSGARAGTITAKVKLKGFPASLAIWAEFGTAAHWIRIDPRDRTGPKGKISIGTINKNAKEAGSLVIAGNFVGPSVYHPGARDIPFLRPALDANQDAAVEAAASYIRTRLENAGLNAPDFGIDDGGPE